MWWRGGCRCDIRNNKDSALECVPSSVSTDPLTWVS
jgi:hypothetical protein